MLVCLQERMDGEWNFLIIPKVVEAVEVVVVGVDGVVRT